MLPQRPTEKNFARRMRGLACERPHPPDGRDRSVLDGPCRRVAQAHGWRTERARVGRALNGASIVSVVLYWSDIVAAQELGKLSY
jgi:hypothetical protein